MNLDADLIYKIIAIGFFIVGPLLPAFILYKISSKDKILARGSFAGFQINATGATAVFVVLFAALYVKMDDVINSIDKYEEYNKTINSMRKKDDEIINNLTKKQPWQVYYRIQLVDGNNPVNAEDYGTYITEKSLLASPNPLLYNNQTHTVSFYIPDESFESGPLTGSIVLTNGFGTEGFSIDRNDTVHANPHSKTITFTEPLHKASKSNYTSPVSSGKPTSEYFNIGTGSKIIAQNPK